MKDRDKFFDKHGFDKPNEEVQKRPGMKFVKECGCAPVQLIAHRDQVYAVTLDKNGCPKSMDNVTDVIKPNANNPNTGI